MFSSGMKGAAACAAAPSPRRRALRAALVQFVLPVAKMLDIADIINGSFEVLSGCAVLNHCRILYRDKEVKGVSAASTAFFMAWGVWNLFYYPHLDQWLSFMGGVVITIANTLWLGMMLYYRRKSWLFVSSAHWSNLDAKPITKDDMLSLSAMLRTTAHKKSRTSR